MLGPITGRRPARRKGVPDGLRHGRAGRRISLTLAATAFGLLAAGPAAALAADGTVSFDGTDVRFTAGAGTVNAVTYTASAAGVTITDTGALIQAGPGCTGGNSNTVTCTPTAPAAIESVSLDLGDLNDGGTGNGSLGALLLGGEGDDTLVGSDTNSEGEEYLVGGNGADNINSRNVGSDTSGFGFAVGDTVAGDDAGEDPAGDGNDTIVTGNGNDSAFGEGGVDTINTGAGADGGYGGAGDGDQVDLGEGDDRSFLSAGPDDGVSDVLQGGPGFDSLDFDGATFGPPATTVFDTLVVDLTAGTASRINNAPEANTVAGIEDVSTNEGFSTDFVTGTAGSNQISTGSGNDAVNPQGGADTVYLGAGNDSADTRDGFSDRVVCGRDADTVAVDQFDELSGCETVTVTQARPAGADLTAPECALARVKNRYSRRAFFKGLRARVTCNEAARVTMQVLVGVKGGRIITSKVGDLVLAERTVAVGAGVARAAKLKPRKKLGRRLGKRFKARVRVEARDEFGNRTVKAKRLRVTPAKRKKKSNPRRNRRRG